MTPNQFAIGQRVALHPATAHFMQGLRYANVTKIGRIFVHVVFDNGVKARIIPHNLSVVI